MRRVSPLSVAVIAFWVAYGVAAAIALYRASGPVQRDLLLVLGGFSLLFAAVTGVWTGVKRLFASRGRVDG